MKRLLFILFLFGAVAAQGADLITASITLTNIATNGATITVQGSTRTWTNDITSSPGTLVQQTNDIPLATTNLLNHLTAYPAAFGHFLSQSNATNVSIRGKVGEVMAVTTSGGYALITYSTQTVSSPTYVMRQPYTVEAAAVQTNLASWTAKHLTLSTNPVDGVRITNAVGLHGTVNKLTGGWLTNSAIDKANLTNGVADGLRMTNAIALHGTNHLLYGGTIEAATITNSTITNVNNLHGILLGLTNGVLTGTRLTNGIGLNGTVHIFTNGYYTNAILDNPKLTNGVNYGNAFSSVGTAAGSEQFGTGALATNTSATALGNTAIAGGNGSLALGNGALSTNEQSIAIGASSIAGGYRAIALGVENSALGYNSVAINATTDSTHTNSIAIGGNTTERNQVVLGSATVALVTVPGRIQAGSYTNAILTGTNVNSGDWSDDESTSTSLANGNNVAVAAGSVFTRLAAGRTAAFAICGIQGGRTGRKVEFWNDTGQTMTIANESGVDPTAANHILTTTGADVVCGTNTYVSFRYSAARSRWVLRSKSN